MYGVILLTCGELRDALIRLCDAGCESRDISILLGASTCGPSESVVIAAVGECFDWDAGRVFLFSCSDLWYV